ncbi:MAG TPA: phosphodiester glycosidase family protein, partial [Acidimicrobiales bacterium]|nr:phosphodiester glycosidase family protein [Acidimicrobiales bacterium]
HRVRGRNLRRVRARQERIYRRRRMLAIIGVVLAALLIWLAISLGGALTNPAYGTSMSSRFAEWARQNGAGSIVNKVENIWYSHHAPKVGGKVPTGAIRAPASTPTTVASGPPHLPAPAAVVPFASPAVAGEGQWSPAGRLVDGVPAVYTTELRPDAVHTSYVVGMAWMDTKLLHATLYSGSQIPGGGPFTHTAPVQATAANSLVSAFNAGFLSGQSNGGYYTDGKTLTPLRAGAASAVIYSDGTMTVADWGRDATLTPNVVAVRQNLDLIVDGGQPVPGLNASDTTQWGNTLGGAVYVYRSGLGVTASGALVYVGGPGLNITDLANLLVRAGATRAMELDINTDWVNYSYYSPTSPYGAATPDNGTMLLPQMTGTAGRYFASYWARDFFTMSSAYPNPPTTSTTTSKPHK